MSTIAKKIQKAQSAWACQAIEDCRPYLPEQLPAPQRQAASLFFYVCAIDPKKEAETVCRLLEEAWEEPSEQRVQKAAELLSTQYYKPISKSVESYLPSMFAPAGQRNFAMRKCANHVLEHCRRQMKKPITQEEHDEYEARCQHLVHVREQIKQAENAANRLKEDWNKAHVFSGTVRFRKEQTNCLVNFLKDPDPANNLDCGKSLETFTFPDGSIVTFSLECMADNEKKLPVLLARLNKNSITVEKSFYSTQNREMVELRAGDYVYYLKLEYYERNEWVYENAKLGRDRMKSEYPKNLIGEILDTIYADTPSDFIKSELEKAIACLDERKRAFVLLRYRDRKTYREIGEAWGLTPSRVRDVTNQGIRQLRTIRLSRILKGEETTLPQPSEQKAANSETLIESCNFSARLFNCLMRANIPTLEKLQSVSWTDLYHIRNFGAGCRKELEEYCKARQIVLKE